MKKIDSQSSLNLEGGVKRAPRLSQTNSVGSNSEDNSDYDRPHLNRNTSSMVDSEGGSRQVNGALMHRTSSVFGLGGTNLSMVDSETAQENYKTLLEIFEELIRLCSSNR